MLFRTVFRRYRDLERALGSGPQDIFVCFIRFLVGCKGTF